MSIVERLEAILRRDLKLGADISLGADTALFGGELDLDSLDALLLVQSIEKEFEVKVASDAMQPEVFATMSTLTQFVERQAQQHTG